MKQNHIIALLAAALVVLATAIQSCSDKGSAGNSGKQGDKAAPC